uniref:Uncharacterized protein n=1 Tax=Anguilla anguilla TaxID=7936 RepID=A0A0E9VMU5_ANGAN
MDTCHVKEIQQACEVVSMSIKQI